MRNSNVLAGFLAGAAVGLVAGILFAPHKGSNTRKKIADKAGELTDSMKDSFGNLVDGVKKTFSEATDEMEKIREKAKTNKNVLKSQVRKTLS